MRDFHTPSILKVFLSYTSREDEVREIQPFVDAYCRALWEWAKRNGIFIFYDHFSLDQSRYYPNDELNEILFAQIRASDVFIGFISPNYVGSSWCCQEWTYGPMNTDSRAPKNPLITQCIYWKPDYTNARPKNSQVVADIPSHPLVQVFSGNGSLYISNESVNHAVGATCETFQKGLPNGEYLFR